MDTKSLSTSGVSSIPVDDPTLPGLTSPSSLANLIRTRHSTRVFLPKPVPPAVLRSCLETAQHAASNSNTQPWRLILTSGSAHNRLVDALMVEAKRHGPNIPALPDSFKHFRSEFGRVLYGPDGYDIQREDKEARNKLVLRNYEFFGAPVAGVICIPRDLSGGVDALGVGMWLMALMLTLWEKGVGCCAMVSVAGYPEVLRRELGIGEDLEILCGLAIGYPDLDKKVNTVDAGRLAVEECVTFMEQ